MSRPPPPPPPPPLLALGGFHTCAYVTSSALLKCWGSNGAGQLGAGTYTDRYTPTTINVGGAVGLLALGDSHTCAFVTSGALLKCWGWNGSGQLGDGTTTDRYNPTTINVGGAVGLLALGGYHTCAYVTSSALLKCWGSNGAGQLGAGTYTDRYTPTTINVGGAVGLLALGDAHTCAYVTSSALLKCWGYNWAGQLGDGTTTDRTTPTTINVGGAVGLLALGNAHTCAYVTSSALLKCWGYNWAGQLGDGTTTDRRSSTFFPGLALPPPSPPPRPPPPPSPPPRPPPPPSPPSRPPPPPSPIIIGAEGIIIGAVVGVIAVVGTCIGVVIVLRRKRSQRPKPRGGVQDELMAPPTASRTSTHSSPSRADVFSSTLLPEALDCVLLRTRVRRLRPMLKPGRSWIFHSPGVLRAPVSDCEMHITAGRLYLEQKDAADGANSSGTFEQWPLATLTSVRRRRHELRHTALELLMTASHSGHQAGGAQGPVVLEFHSHEEREQVVRTLVGQKPHLRPLDEQLPEMTEKWHAGEIDNYTYLLHLNDCASRSFDDLSQYPIMPWVLSDYSSDALDLNDPRRYRPLWKPVGALDESRLAATHRQRHELQVDAEAGQTTPLYRTHYSSPAYVAYYLLRIFPELTFHINSGKFDKEARSFLSVDRTWQNVSERAHSGDVKELIPQFYSEPTFLTNEMGDAALPPGCKNVGLPPWACGSSTEFVRQMRAALESDFVSAHLHLWIDLIFGSKQQGAPALKANNLFESYTYESALDSNKLDDAARELIRACATDFGQTPPQLFAQAHPPRRLRVNGLPQPWKAAEPSATLIQANARRWLGPRHIVANAVEFFFDEKAFRGTAELSIKVPPVDVVLRIDDTDGFSFAYSKRTKDWMLALGAAAEAASDEQEIGTFLESCFRSDDERRYAPSEFHPFANALREYCGLVSQLFAQNGRSPASRMSAAVRLKNMSKAVQLGLKRMHAIVVRVLPPLQKPRRSALVRALVLDEITTRLFRPLIMPLIQSVHGADDAAYADSVARFAQLRPHHLKGIVNLPPHFWLGSRDADASPPPPLYTRAPGKPICNFGTKCYRKNREHFAQYDHPADHPFFIQDAACPAHVPYATAIKALAHLSATYSTRRKLALLMDVLQAIQHHVWSYHGIASPEDQANDKRLRLAADDLISVFAYVLSQARPVLHLCSELAFIERFADDGCLLGEHGYCLATVQAASGFLRTLTWPQIELGLQNAHVIADVLAA